MGAAVLGGLVGKAFGEKAGAVVNPAGFLAGKVGGTAGKLIDPAGALLGQQDNDKKKKKPAGQPRTAAKSETKVNGLLDDGPQDTSTTSLL